MCGIVGVVDRTMGHDEIHELLRRMNDSIIHRGPDGEGYFAIDGVGMAMRRLSIIDLAGGDQPIFNEDGSVAVVFNGEIYNYKELRAELVAKGHTFRTESDTETIVHLYEEMGEDCVTRLRGMFAIAIFDARARTLFLARDRLGIKPLYYTRAGGRFVFGSEIKAVVADPSVPRTIDMHALGDYLTLKYVPSPRTMFEGIESLPPGHRLVVTGDDVRVEPYWSLSFGQVDETASEEQMVRELGEQLRESVRLRLQADVPFGAMLSGGLDSSTIVALMAEMLEEPVKTFSVGFDGPSSELPYARRVAELFGTDHHELEVRGRDFPDMMEKIVWHLDQPLADQATIATYMVSELARKDVKVVLSGEGGDELFAGYTRYSGERLRPVTRLIPEAMVRPASRLADRVFKRGRVSRAMRALTTSNEAARYVEWFGLMDDETKAGLLTPDARNAIDFQSPTEAFAAHLERTDATEPMNRMLFVDSKLWLPDYLLLRGDKMTMAASVEGRVPLLDHHLVEFAARVPTRLKIRGTTQKYLLKQFARSVLPDEIVDRKKAGFPIPIDDWFRGEMHGFLRDVLSPESIGRRGLFDPDTVATMLDEHHDGVRNHAHILWSLVNFEIWCDQMIDAGGRSRANC